MNVGLITVLLFGSMLIPLAMGIPIAFALGGVAVIFIFLMWDVTGLIVLPAQAMSAATSFVLVALPLFIFMGNMLQRSGVAEKLYETFYRWLGPVRGGLAMGTVLICTIFAAMAGISGAATVTMGVVALPSMLKRNYDKKIAIGCISAGGALGVLIPPSILMILLSLFTGVSVGRLFAGGVIPGLVLAALFIGYIAVRCWFQPNLGPALPPEDRVTWSEKIISLRAVILPILLVLAVLGTIFTGIATPTEAAAVGAMGSIICAAIGRQLTWQNLKEASYASLRLTVMVMWIFLGASCFANVYTAVGGPQFMNEFILGLGLNRWVVFIGMQLSFFILGCFLDPTAIMMITTPVFLPLIITMGFDPLWYGIVFVVNMEMAFLTPPFGFNLFYMKGVVPKGITMGDIYRSVGPFVILQAIGLIIVILFPSLATWLPNLWLG